MHQQQRQRQIEQIEIIERTVTESARPITTAEALAFQPHTSVRTSTEQFTTADSAFNPEKRFQLTSERDAGHDPSLLYSPSGGQPSFVKEPPLHQSTPEKASSVNQFGYDLHEVQTAEGGARVIETHGSGHLMLDRSLTESIGKQRSSGKLHSILKHPGASAGQEGDMSSENSLHRKDSYKRMQDQSETEQQQNTSFYGQSSNATIISKPSSKKGLNWNSNLFGARKHDATNEDSCGRLKSSIAELSRQLRVGEWTPRLIAALVLLCLFILILILLLWFILSAIFLRRSTYSFWLYPPVCEECQKQGKYRSPSKLYVHLYSPAQAHFELIGNPPFKSNSFTAVDFDTGYIAIADHALTDNYGRHTTCFLMQLDRTAIPDMDVLVDALKNTYEEVHAQFGWQEYWQFTVEQVDQSFVAGKFKDNLEDCQNVQWYFLKHSVYTKDESCSYCYDFCLPDYAVLRRQKYEDEVSLGLRRLNCFRLYVPEWAKYQFQTDPTGGHFGYPIHQPTNTQRDASRNWVSWHYAPEQPSSQFNRRKKEIGG